MSISEEPIECPLCMEPLEIDDISFYPCTCGYQICRFCWHRIRTDENGLCPACRKQYPEDPAEFKPLTEDELVRIKKERRQKDSQRKQKAAENRKHLANVRVVQKNLVFVVGLTPRLADPDLLRKHEYFGKFGKIHKVVINQSTTYAGSQGPSSSAYLTYLKSEDALKGIQAVNNAYVDGRTLKASLGTTKYCSHFLKGTQCQKSDCMYLHELGEKAASFTKEEMQLGKHQEYEQRLIEDFLNHQNSLHHSSKSHNIARKGSGSSPPTIPLSESPGVTSQHQPVTSQPPSNTCRDSWPSLQTTQQQQQQQQQQQHSGGTAATTHTGQPLGVRTDWSTSNGVSSKVSPPLRQTETQHRKNSDTALHSPVGDDRCSPASTSSSASSTPAPPPHAPTQTGPAPSQTSHAPPGHLAPPPQSQSLAPSQQQPQKPVQNQQKPPTNIPGIGSSSPVIPPPPPSSQSAGSHGNHHQLPSPNSNHGNSAPVPLPHSNGSHGNGPYAGLPGKMLQGLTPENSLSLFSDNGFARGQRHKHMPPLIPDEVQRTEVPDQIPASTSTDWQAAFGFPSATNSHIDDDLGFDPWDESSKALADLIEHETHSPPVSLTRGFQPPPPPPGFQHPQHFLPKTDFGLGQSKMAFMAGYNQAQQQTPASRPPGFMPPNMSAQHKPTQPFSVDGHPQGDDIFNMKEWQEGLRALLPNINISFGASPYPANNNLGQRSNPQPINNRGSGWPPQPPLKNSLTNQDPAILTSGFKSNANGMSESPPHWMRSLQQLTDLDQQSQQQQAMTGQHPPQHNRLPFVRNFSNTGMWGSGQVQTPPPGFRPVQEPHMAADYQ